MKATSFSAKSNRTKLFSLITVLLLVAVIGLNFLFYANALDNTVFFDMTKEGLYSVSSLMREECESIFTSLRERGENQKVKVIFCTDPDYLMGSDDMRLSYVLMIKLRNMFPDMIELETVNVDVNPTAVAQYKTTSLSKIEPYDIIFSYGDRYRIVDGQSFWLDGTNNDTYYNGEYRIATLIKSVTALSQPVAYFVVGHGETVYDPEKPESEMSIKMASFADLLYERGLTIKTLDLSKIERIPEDCALLIVNNPREDFGIDEDRLGEMAYVSETEILDRYLVMKQGAIIVATDYALDWSQRPNFRGFLVEWGFELGDTLVKDKENSLSDLEGSDTKIVASYDTSVESFGHAIYGEYADLSSSPLTVFENTGIIKCAFAGTNEINEPGANNVTRHYTSFLKTSKTAELYYKNSMGEYVDKAGEAGNAYDLISVAVRREIDQRTDESTYSYMLCVNSPDFFSSDLLGEPSYANFDIVSAVINNISRVDEHASVDLGGKSFNSISMGGKKLIPTTMSKEDVKINSNKHIDDDISKGLILIKHNKGLPNAVVVFVTVLVALIPLSVSVVGIVINIKRRNL